MRLPKKISALPGVSTIKNADLFAIVQDGVTSKVTFTVLEGVISGFTASADTYVTGGVYNSGTSTIDFTGNTDFPPFSVNVSALTGTFTGNTSGDCIQELWVNTISGCSPVRIGSSILSPSGDASGIHTIAYGKNVTASGNYSRAKGFSTTSSGLYSHSGGKGMAGISSKDTTTVYFCGGFYTAGTPTVWYHFAGKNDGTPGNFTDISFTAATQPAPHPDGDSIVSIKIVEKTDSDKIVALLANGGPYWSDDGGATWVKSIMSANTSWIYSGNTLATVAIATDRSSKVWVGGILGSNYYSSDAGKTFIQQASYPSPLPYSGISGSTGTTFTLHYGEYTGKLYASTTIEDKPNKIYSGTTILASTSNATGLTPTWDILNGGLPYTIFSTDSGQTIVTDIIEESPSDIIISQGVWAGDFDSIPPGPLWQTVSGVTGMRVSYDSGNTFTTLSGSSNMSPWVGGLTNYHGAYAYGFSRIKKLTSIGPEPTWSTQRTTIPYTASTDMTCEMEFTSPLNGYFYDITTQTTPSTWSIYHTDDGCLTQEFLLSGSTFTSGETSNQGTLPVFFTHGNLDAIATSSSGITSGEIVASGRTSFIHYERTSEAGKISLPPETSASTTVFFGGLYTGASSPYTVFINKSDGTTGDITNINTTNIDTFGIVKIVAVNKDDANNLITLGQNANFSGVTVTGLLKWSNNGGGTWNTPGLTIPSWSGSSYGGDPNSLAVDRDGSNSDVWIAGDGGVTWYSSDGGQNYTQQTSVPAPGGVIMSGDSVSYGLHYGKYTDKLYALTSGGYTTQYSGGTILASTTNPRAAAPTWTILNGGIQFSAASQGPSGYTFVKDIVEESATDLVILQFVIDYSGNPITGDTGARASYDSGNTFDIIQPTSYSNGPWGIQNKGGQLYMYGHGQEIKKLSSIGPPLTWTVTSPFINVSAATIMDMTFISPLEGYSYESFPPWQDDWQLYHTTDGGITKELVVSASTVGYSGAFNYLQKIDATSITGTTPGGYSYTNMGALAHNSAILGGTDHNIETSSINSGIFAGSANTISSGASISVIIGGENNIIDHHPFVSGVKNIAMLGGSNLSAYTAGDNNVLIGGENNSFPAGIGSPVARSVILGGSGIIGLRSDTVYVPSLNIVTPDTSSMQYNLGIDTSGFVVTGATGGGGGGGTGTTCCIDPYNNIGSASTLTWDVSGTSTNYKITLTGDTTLTMSNVRDGDSGNLIIFQDSVGNRELTFSGGTHYIVNGGDGSTGPTLTTNINARDILSFTYDGDEPAFYWTVGNDYT